MKVISVKKLAKTKQKLLTLLKKERDMTIEDIMVHFTISEIAVRKHLRELEYDNYIKKESIKQKIGRPYHIFKLTKYGHHLFPNQYKQLPLELLKDLEEIQGREAVSQLLEQRMKREKRYLKKEMTSAHFDKRIEKVAEIQDKKGCMVEVKENEDGDYEIIHYNCPIANIATTYHEICQNEKYMYKDIFSDSEVISTSRITNGDHCCKWVIKKPKKA